MQLAAKYLVACVRAIASPICVCEKIIIYVLDLCHLLVHNQMYLFIGNENAFVRHVKFITVLFRDSLLCVHHRKYSIRKFNKMNAPKKKKIIVHILKCCVHIFCRVRSGKTKAAFLNIMMRQ